MTEWHLQKLLTQRWSADGVDLPDGNRAFLTAWEVMTPSWQINASRNHESTSSPSMRQAHWSP